jgi:hypothetical protein
MDTPQLIRCIVLGARDNFMDRKDDLQMKLWNKIKLKISNADTNVRALNFVTVYGGEQMKTPRNKIS